MYVGAFAITNKCCVLIVKIHLLWRRAMRDPGHKRIFCLVCEHNLSYKIAKEVVQSLRELSQGHTGRHLFVGIVYLLYITSGALQILGL